MSNSNEPIRDAKQLGTGKVLVLGLQHMFAMFGATVLVPIITGLSVSATLLFAGLATLFMHLITGKKVPVFLGSSFAFLGGYAAVVAAGEQYGLTQAQSLPYACVGVACAGLLYLVLAAICKVYGSKNIIRFFPPVVTGPIIIAIGMNLAPSAINNCESNWFVAIVAVITIIICNIIFRVFLSKRIKKNDEKKRQNFEIKKNYYITAWSMVLFSLVMVVLTNMIENNYFFKMASRLLVEFSLLISAIIASMLFRFEAQQLRHGVRLYLPIVTMGFIVILFRIIFVPNSVVNLLLPPLLLVATIFQYKGVHKYSNEVPVADKYYTWISFATILASCIASWSGFTLLAVQIFMWWMIQLTCIHGITCCYDAMQNFEKRYFEVDLHRKYDKDKVKAIRNAYNKRPGEYFKLTALYDFINMTLIPVLAVISLPVCIYWASDIFDMKDAWAKIFFADFIDIEDVILFGISVIGKVRLDRDEPVERRLVRALAEFLAVEHSVIDEILEDVVDVLRIDRVTAAPDLVPVLVLVLLREIVGDLVAGPLAHLDVSRTVEVHADPADRLALGVVVVDLHPVELTLPDRDVGVDPERTATGEEGKSKSEK